MTLNIQIRSFKALKNLPPFCVRSGRPDRFRDRARVYTGCTPDLEPPPTLVRSSPGDCGSVST